MGGVGLECGPVDELHDAAKLIPLRTWREIRAYKGFDQSWNLALESTDFLLSALFLRLGGVGFPAEGERMKNHATILVGIRGATVTGGCR